MKALFIISVIMFFACACQVKDQQNEDSDRGSLTPANNFTAPLPPVAPVGFNDKSQNLFKQSFELENNLFVNFKSCRYDAWCWAYVDEIYPEKYYDCFTYDLEGNPLTPGQCRDYSDDVACVVNVMISTNGIMTIREVLSSHKDEAKCKTYISNYRYEITSCRGIDQKLWKCGTGEQKYDLIWEKL